MTTTTTASTAIRGCLADETQSGNLQHDCDMLAFPFDHDGHAKAVQCIYSNAIKWCPEKKWLVWDGKCWNSNQANENVTRKAINVLRERQHAAVEANRQTDVITRLCTAAKPSNHNVNGTLDILKAYVVAQYTDFDREPHLLNCNNGVVNLITGEITPHSREQMFTYCLDVDYKPEADVTQWEQFLNDSVESAEVAEYLKLAVGYSITGYTSEEVMFYIWGPRRSGKGTFTETLIATLRPSELATEVGFETFVGSRIPQNFDLAPLKPCRFVAASESKEDDWLNGEMVKRVTGGNEINCAFKYGNMFSYRPQFKIWLTSNYRPKGDPDDDALWGRLRVIQFPNSKYGHEDRTLKERLRSEQNREGVLKWAVAGAMEWYTIRGQGLPTPAVVVQNGQDARDESDHVKQFLDEMTTPSPDNYVPSAHLYHVYENWCSNNGHTPKKQNALSRSIAAKGYTRSRQPDSRGFVGFYVHAERIHRS